MPSPFTVVAERIAPSRLGRGFRLLLVASVITNIGDGIALAAGPLLVASQTRDPFLVSMAALAQNLPVLLFGVQAGVVADRVDRVRLMAAVNLVRAAILAVLAVTIVSDAVSIAIVLVALFVLGTAETFADIGGQSVLPRLVRREDLGVANARLVGRRAAHQPAAGAARSGPCCSPSGWRCRSSPTPRGSRSAPC